MRSNAVALILISACGTAHAASSPVKLEFHPLGPPRGQEIAQKPVVRDIEVPIPVFETREIIMPNGERRYVCVQGDDITHGAHGHHRFEPQR